jgi:hypothetical protein
MVGKRVLVIDDVLPEQPCDLLRRFFDVIIAVGEEAGDYCRNPDILVSTRLDPHKNSMLDMAMYDRFKESIICVVQSELSLLKRIAKYHSNYALSWVPVEASVSSSPISDAGISYGLSLYDPGVHLAMIGGATDIFAKSISLGDFQSSINVLISERRGYVPANILRPIRPQFIQEVKFSI